MTDVTAISRTEGPEPAARHNSEPLHIEEGADHGPEKEQEARSSDASFVALEKVKTERDELRDRLTSIQAEFENARKRLAREQDEFKELALADAIKSLLPVVDGFDWALQAPYHNVEEFRSGIDLIRKQLQDSLSNLGLQSIPAKGEPFDPRLHEAIEVVNTAVAPDNEILKDVRRGYKLKDRLLRPAMVLVAHNSDEGRAEEQQRPKSS